MYGGFRRGDFCLRKTAFSAASAFRQRRVSGRRKDSRSPFIEIIGARALAASKAHASVRKSPRGYQYADGPSPGISQSERIVWLCEELELEYELRRYERLDVKGMAPPEYKALHPAGTAPVITDGELTLGESAAICEYICTRYGNGQLVPEPDSPDLADHMFWFHWCNGTFMAALMAQSVLKLANAAQPDNRGASFLTERIAACWEMIEARLNAAPFFGGNTLTVDLH